MSDTSAHSPQTKLPVWPTVKRSFFYLWEQRYFFAVPLFVFFVLEWAENIWGRQTILAEHGDIPVSAAIISFVTALLAAAFSVGILRTILLGELKTGFAFFRGGRSFWRYFGASALLILATGFVGIALAIPTYWVIMAAHLEEGSPATILMIAIVTLVVLFVFIRLLLMTTAGAIGAKNWFALSWRATRGNVLRLLAAHLLVLLILVVPFIVAAIPQAIVDVFMEKSALLGLAKIIAQGPLAAVGTIGIAVTVIMSAFIYETLVGSSLGLAEVTGKPNLSTPIS